MAQIIALGLALFALAAWPRLNLPPRLVTADEDTWLGRTGNFARALVTRDLANTYQIGHPGVTALWVSLAGVGTERAQQYAGSVQHDGRVQTRRVAAREPTFVEDLTAARRAHAIANALLIAAIALLACRLVGTPAGIIAGGLLALDPFLVAHAQVVRMDSLQAGFLGVGLLAVLIRWTLDGHRAYLILAGAAFGLSALSKLSSGLVAVPLLVCLAWKARRLVSTGRRPGEAALDLVKDVAVMSIVAVLAFVAGLPALWVAPATTIDKMIDYTLANSGTPPESGNFLFGQSIADPGPVFYVAALAYRLTPLVVLGLAALILLLRPKARDLGVRTAGIAILALTLFVFLAALGEAPKKADRYLLPVWPAMLVLAGAGLWAFVQWSGKRARLASVGIGFLLAGQLVWLPPISPYALTYYNPLLGGTPAAREAVLIGWGEGLDLAAEFLNQLPDAADLTAATLYSEPFRANFAGRTVPLPRFEEADFLVNYVNMEQRGLLPPELDSYIESTSPLATFDLAGVRFAGVYALPRPEFGGSLRVEQYALETDSQVRDERIKANVRWTPLASTAETWRPRLELFDPSGKPVLAADSPVSGLRVGERGTAVLSFRLPERRTVLTLAVSVIDEAGNQIPVSAAPPWTRIESNRVIFPSISVRVR